MNWKIDDLGLVEQAEGFFSVINKQSVKGPNFYEHENYSERKNVQDYEKDADYYIWYHKMLGGWLQKKILQRLCILDFGCGVGHGVEGLNSAGINAFGVDISPDAVNFGREKKGRDISVASISDVFDICEERQINCVYSKNCLEHLTEPRLAINELIRNLNVKYLCISVPNDFSAFQYEANKIVKRKHWWVDTIHHANYFSHTAIEKICLNFGFRPMARLGTYPLELEILAGTNYVDNPELGRKAHNTRVTFEKSLGEKSPEALLKVYEAFGEIGVGRDAICLLKRDEAT